MRPEAEVASGWRVPLGAAPFIAEKFLKVGTTITLPQVIVDWQVPKASVALLQSFAIQSPSPHAFFECLFDLAVDGKPISNIRFAHMAGNDEKPPDFLKLFEEGQKIQLRLYWRDPLFGEAGFETGYTTLLIGRLGGKVWGRN